MRSEANQGRLPGWHEGPRWRFSREELIEHMRRDEPEDRIRYERRRRPVARRDRRVTSMAEPRFPRADRVRQLEYALSVLDLFRPPDRGELSLSAIADELGLSEEYANKLLRHLEAAGIVVGARTGSGAWRLGIRLAQLGGYAILTLRPWDEFRPPLAALQEATGLGGLIAVLSGGRAVHIDHFRGPERALGRAFPAHATALGKAILAETRIGGPRRRTRRDGARALDRPHDHRAGGRPGRGPPVARERGYALEDGEFHEARRSIGAAVRDHSGTVVAAVGVGSTLSRLPDRGDRRGRARRWSRRPLRSRGASAPGCCRDLPPWRPVVEVQAVMEPPLEVRPAGAREAPPAKPAPAPAAVEGDHGDVSAAGQSLGRPARHRRSGRRRAAVAGRRPPGDRAARPRRVRVAGGRLDGRRRHARRLDGRSRCPPRRWSGSVRSSSGRASATGSTRAPWSRSRCTSRCSARRARVRGSTTPSAGARRSPFASWQANIATVARGLAQGYVARGRDTLAAIQPVWAPLGAANDPTGLNSAWTDAVGPLLRGHRRRSVGLDRLRARARRRRCRRRSARSGRGAAPSGPVEALARLTGLPVTSAKRTRQTDRERGHRRITGSAAPSASPTTSGRRPRRATPRPRGSRARSAGPGYADWGRTGGVLNVERCGIRFQLLWRTYVGGNHWNHIHIGARRVGYAP